MLTSACKKTQSALRKRQDQGARSPKKRSVHTVLEHFWDERNEGIGVFLEALTNFRTYFCLLSAVVITAFSIHTKSESEVNDHSQDFESYYETIQGTDVQIKMKPVPGGTNKIGDHKENHNGASTAAIVVDSFWVSKYPVTWEQYNQFKKDVVSRESDLLTQNALDTLGIDADAISVPSQPWIDITHGMGEQPNFPAISMTHYAAAEFGKWLTAQTGEFYRLPTEAEWEYACKAGYDSPFGFDNYEEELEEYAWFSENSENSYQEVGTRKPNNFGIYDMNGNVAEWVMDQFVNNRIDSLLSQSPTDTLRNPWIYPEKLYPRTAKGGSWRDSSGNITCHSRTASDPDWSRDDPQLPRSQWWHTNAPFVGFRLVRPFNVPDKDSIETYWIPEQDDIY